MRTTVIFFKNKLFAELRENIQELRDNLWNVLDTWIYNNSTQNSYTYWENHHLRKYDLDLSKCFDSISNEFYFDDIFEVNSDKQIELSSLEETVEFFNNNKDNIFLKDKSEIVENKLNSFWKENPNGLIRIC